MVARAIARDTAAAGGRDTSLCGSLCETDPNPARLIAQNDVIEAWIVGLAGGDEPVHEVREVDRGHLWSDAGWKPVVEDIGVDRLPRRGPGVGAQQDKELAVAAAELGTVQIDYEWENRWQDVCGKPPMAGRICSPGPPASSSKPRPGTTGTRGYTRNTPAGRSACDTQSSDPANRGKTEPDDMSAFLATGGKSSPIRIRQGVSIS